MSYILEALRKSDQQRNRGATPTLFGGQEAMAVRRKPAFVLYGVLAVSLIGAGIAIGVLRPWQTPQAEMAERAPIVVHAPVAAPAPPPPVAAAAPPQLQDTMAPAISAPVAQSAPAPVVEPKPVTRPKRRVERPIRKAEPSVADRSNPEPVPQAGSESPAAEPAHAEPPAAEPANGESVGTLSDLPPSIRDELPKIRITVHAYSSKRASRLVGYENRILREGDSLVPGLKIEEITPDGMILSYKGYRFSRGAN
jgi:general secretion pathway protein B